MFEFLRKLLAGSNEGEIKKLMKIVEQINASEPQTKALTDDQLRDIAQEYMERMGYGNQPYIVFKHKDIDRQHLHIVSLRVDENGHKLSHDFETE